MRDTFTIKQIEDMCRLAENHTIKPERFTKNSFELLWLKIVMKQNSNKTWNGEEWV